MGIYLNGFSHLTPIIHGNTFDMGTEKLSTIFVAGQYSKGTAFIAFYSGNRPT